MGPVKTIIIESPMVVLVIIPVAGKALVVVVWAASSVLAPVVEVFAITVLFRLIALVITKIV